MFSEKPGFGTKFRKGAFGQSRPGVLSLAVLGPWGPVLGGPGVLSLGSCGPEFLSLGVLEPGGPVLEGPGVLKFCPWGHWVLSLGVLGSCGTVRSLGVQGS